MADDTPREEDHEPGADGDAPSGAPEPISDEVAAAIVERFPGSVFAEHHGQPVVYVDRAVVADVAVSLRDAEQFTMLVDTVVVDHLLDGSRLHVAGVVPERFEVVVNFLSHTRNRRIRIVAQVPESDPTVPSLTPTFAGANFPERESYDLVGITFDGHPDLTRILMPDDWNGHPLRKDDAAARVPVTFKGDPSPR
ncbi:MAG: NADH-quinone oxidoreductase subunit C [Acidimicrobiia bacterium]